METKTIQIKATGGAVTIRIDASQFPQSVAGNVWRYTKNKTPDGKAGIFNSHIHEVPLGIPGEIAEKFFLVSGVVIHQNDDPPTPYQVIFEVVQDGTSLLKEVPLNWAGLLSDKDIAIKYKLQLVTQ